MGNQIKRIVKNVLNFFKKASQLILETSKKICEAMVNGAKKLYQYYKKVFYYDSKGIKLISKAIYFQGHQYIHSLTGKKGIPLLIKFFKELSDKKVTIKDENNKEIDIIQHFKDLEKKMDENDMIKLRYEICKKNNIENDDEEDFGDDNEDSLEDILDLKTNENFGNSEEEKKEINNLKQQLLPEI